MKRPRSADQDVDDTAAGRLNGRGSTAKCLENILFDSRSRLVGPSYILLKERMEEKKDTFSRTGHKPGSKQTQPSLQSDNSLEDQ